MNQAINQYDAKQCDIDMPMRSNADAGQLNLPHGTVNEKQEN